MERLFKKCVLGSALAHIGLISLIVLFAGFARKSDDFESFKPITIINLDNVIVTDGPTRGGGNGSLPPVITPPQPKPVQQQPVQPPPPPPPKPVQQKPASEPAVQEEPAHKPDITSRTKNTRNSDESSEETSLDGKLPPKSRSTGIKISTNLVVRKGVNTTTTSKSPRTSGAVNKLAQEFNSAIQNIGAGISSGGLRMDDVPGFGGGGPAMINYTQLIMSIFDRAWIPPSEITDENLVAEVKIVIHRSGKVTSARITKRSGNAAMDASVMKALDSVTSVPPFPAESRDFERTFVIEFNLKAKLARG